MRIVLRSLARYAQFQGRARRPEFWFFYLLYAVVTFAGGFVSWWLQSIATGYQIWLAAIPGGLWLLLFIPFIAVAVRRLHDIDRSGWWLLMNFVPFGGILLLIYFCREGDVGDNRFGPPEPN
jgi:uncharacterized membrane protein YhaH (DUF805 family)